ncbi:MAG: FxsA family protein [Hyphomicrobiales bacterium]
MIVFFLLLFIAVPILEIAVLIKAGAVIGIGPTLACVIATAVIGTILIRIQGFVVLGEARQKLARDEVPVDSVIHGLFLLIAGTLLLTPGFITDFIGFMLLIAPVRLSLARWLWQRFSASGRSTIIIGAGRQSGSSRNGPIIEGTAIEDPDIGENPSKRHDPPKR